MTKFGRVIGKTRWTMRIRLELAEVPDAGCGVAGAPMVGASAPKAACPAGCPGCGPTTSRPPIVELPLTALRDRGAGFAPGERVRVEFNGYGTAVSALVTIGVPLLGGILVCFAFFGLSRVAAYLAGVAACAILGFLATLLRQRSAFLAGATVFPV
jgi:hypothetical protein